MGTAEGTIGQENQEGEWTSMCILSPSLPPNTTSLSPLTCASSMAGTGLKRTNGNWEAYRKGKYFFLPSLSLFYLFQASKSAVCLFGVAARIRGEKDGAGLLMYCRQQGCVIVLLVLDKWLFNKPDLYTFQTVNHT